MTKPNERPKPPADASDHTLEHRPAAKLDDLYPTIANNPAVPQRAERPALYDFLAPPVGTDEIGRLGHFRIFKLLGAGGMGMVFLAEDTRLGRQVALKVVKPRDDNPELAGQRFLKEARAIAQIKHDNLVTIYEVGQQGATVFYAMELLAGESLEARIQRVMRWDLADILRVGQELAAGLAAMHEHGLIHRDIKPTNIWLEAREAGPAISANPRHAPFTPRVKILDFGLVRNVKDDIALTETGIVMGTPAFMSPEQVRGKKVDARTDLYSFGCILYRLCAGKYPHDADNSMAQLAAVVADEPEPISKLNPEIPPPLAKLVMQLLTKKPEDRPRSAALVVDRLRQMQRSYADSGPRALASASDGYDTSELTLQPSFWRRHGGKLLMLGGGVGALSLGVITVLLLAFAWPGRPDGKGPPPLPKAVDKKPIVNDKQFLSDMKPVLAVSWPFFKKGGKKPPKDFEDGVIVNGVESPHGIFMHAAHPGNLPASLSYQLDKKFQSFTTKVSLNDSSFGSKEAMIFTVYGDGKQLWQSRNVWTAADGQDIALDVKDVAILKLEVAIRGDDVGGAHGAWIEPHLTRAGK